MKKMKHISKYFEFYDHGCAADAQTVVFLPGVACSTWMFRDAVKQFLPNYKVVLFNNPCTGETGTPFNLTVPKIAGMVAQVLQHLNLKNCTVVGHSMGGYTTQQLTQLAPELVKRIVLVSTSCGGSFTRREMKRLFKDLGADFWKRRRNFLDEPEEAINYVFSESFMKSHWVDYKIFAHRFHDLKPRQSVVARHFICASRFSSEGFLEKIDVPTLVIHGNEDNLIDIEGGQILAKSIPLARYLEVEKCGHFPMIERKEFYKDIIAFMEGKKIGKEI
ncbi:MAG: pimeloyl-ACP methyl ester carboxylesterase [Alphaproteobacteria bacterium]|jgi:pimeloyl-ACP methyl ester carboxylesterase